MNTEDKKQLLNLLTEMQKNTAPIVVSIGYVSNNIVQHDAIVIKEAAPVITQELIQRGYHLSVDSNGVTVDKY